MANDDIHFSPNQLVLPHLRGYLLSWWGGSQTYMPYEFERGEARSPERGDSFVIKTFVKQVSFVGEIFRYQVDVRNDSYIWRKLPT